MFHFLLLHHVLNTLAKTALLLVAKSLLCFSLSWHASMHLLGLLAIGIFLVWTDNTHSVPRLAWPLNTMRTYF